MITSNYLEITEWARQFGLRWPLDYLQVNIIPKDSRLALEGFDWLKDKTLTDDRIEKVKLLGALANDLETNTTQLALAWCLKNPNVSTLILGASRVDQLEENFQSLEIAERLSTEVMERIEELGIAIYTIVESRINF